ncbi:MAG: T9SS type A sorting domain-containing protein [Saprospiraceae bacterium]|nr:T9SS type A sorting domain-containing protein [Saprospiraceae bacterium]
MTKTLALATLVASVIAFVSPTPCHAQSQVACAPNCRDINASIQLGEEDDWYAHILWSDILTNYDCALPIAYQVKTSFGAIVHSGSSNDVGNDAYFIIEDPCSHLENGVTVHLTNGVGTCSSNITFKTGTPQMESNRFFLRCDDPSVTNVDQYVTRFYGDSKPAYIPCEAGLEPSQFVADWIIPFDCVPGLDTSKIILREFEAFTKTGIRTSIMDTIIVLRMPELVAENIFCAESDTVYCGFGAAGPYWSVPEIDPLTGFPTGDCDIIHFLSILNSGGSADRSLVFQPRTFDSKCGVTVHVDQQKFSDECNPQYRVEIQLKQNCFGSPMETCLVSPPADGPGSPNAFEQLGPGYWTCSFWITDFDTISPSAKCIYDLGPADRLIPHQCQLGTDASSHCFATPHAPGTQNCSEYQPVMVVSTGSHDCGANLRLPSICAKDDWSGIKQVKASIAGVGTWLLEKGLNCSEIPGGTRFDLEQSIDLSIRGDGQPQQVIYEIADLCHNIDTLYCYILIKDEVKPVAVADKGVNVTLPGGTNTGEAGDKKVWVDAIAFDEGSWDNCDVNLVLARRSDWYQACIDLCDSIDWCCVGDHHDTIWQAKLNSSKVEDPVEAHYAKTLEWLATDGGACTDILYNAWLYDLIKWGTIECGSAPGLNGQEFRSIFESCFLDEDLDCNLDNTYNPLSFPEPDLDLSAKFKLINLHPAFGCGRAPITDCGDLTDDELTGLRARIDLYEQIGGGWSHAVPFDCSDACGPVTVEILVMDQWCNWSKAWTEVWVEDKAPISIEKDVVDGTVYCATYKSERYAYPDELHPVSLEFIVEQAGSGVAVALDALDEIFGGYTKAWVDPYGNYVDAAGFAIDCDIPFSDSTCDCESSLVPMQVFDEHLGYQWVNVQMDTCFFKPIEKEFQKGIVAVNCSENVYCEQEVWSEFDHCGEGYIFRKFKIWQGCPGSPHTPDTLFRHQKIFVGNECVLEKGMFDLPYDTTIFSCGITYDPEGSGNVIGEAGPDQTGAPVYRFDDDCRIVGIAHQDKVFKILGGDAACYKIIRTWYFADWCTKGGVIEEDDWYADDQFVDAIHVQKIIVQDTVPPICVITDNIIDGLGATEASCEFTYEAIVDAADMCGLIDFHWELKNVSNDPAELVQQGDGSIDDLQQGQFLVSVANLTTGSYKLVARVRDDCQNESYCERPFEIVAGKKPSAVCISWINVEVNPMDLDQDGVFDTAMAVVWAEEYNSSSSPACDDQSMEFFIELRDGRGDDVLGPDDLDFVEVGCDNIGMNLVRFYVKSESGSFDFCDVFLIVQDNNNACVPDGPIISNVFGNIFTVDTMPVGSVGVHGFSTTSDQNQTTGPDGLYSFDFVLDENVTITPTRDGNDIDGVTLMDLILLNQHLVMTAIITDPYLRIAADVDTNGVIDGLDVLQLFALSRGDVDTLQFVDSWRFVRESYVFTSPTPEAESFEEDAFFIAADPVIQENFIGIKVGDLDLDRMTSAPPRNLGSAVLETDNLSFSYGDEFVITIHAQDLDEIVGIQSSLRFSSDVLEFLGTSEDLEPLASSDFISDRRVESGIITLAWHDGGNTIALGDQSILALRFRALANGQLSDHLTISDAPIRSEIYPAIRQKAALSLRFAPVEEVNTWMIHPAAPNPVGAYTKIGWTIPEADEVVVSIFDVVGRLVHVDRKEYISGLHEIRLDRHLFTNPGLYYYQIEYNGTSETNKLVVSP